MQSRSLTFGLRGGAGAAGPRASGPQPRWLLRQQSCRLPAARPRSILGGDRRVPPAAMNEREREAGCRASGFLSRLQLLGGDADKARLRKSRLLEAVSGTRLGAACDDSERAEIDALVVELEECKGSPSPTSGTLDGCWKLVYTTEDTVHKIARGLVLGIPVVDVSQSIDLRSLRVTNRIQLAFGCSIQASAPAKVAGERRILYRFDSGQLEAGPLRLGFKPPGGGWTDSTYCDDEFRVVRNSRGDTLIFTRSSRETST